MMPLGRKVRYVMAVCWFVLLFGLVAVQGGRGQRLEGLMGQRLAFSSPRSRFLLLSCQATNLPSCSQQENRGLQNIVWVKA